MKIEIQEHGIMMADYFHGTPGIWLNLYPDETTTLSDIIEMLEKEIDLLYEHIDYVAQNHNFKGDIYPAIDTKISEMKEYIKGKEKTLYCPDIEIDTEEDMENPVAIFTIEFIKE